MKTVEGTWATASDERVGVGGISDAPAFQQTRPARRSELSVAPAFPG